MTKTITIVHRPFDLAHPEAVERIEGVTSIREALREAFPRWPSTARIYDGAIAQARDVTPRVPPDVDHLEHLNNEDVFVVVYPGGPVAIIFAVLAVAAVVATFLFFPTIPSLDNQQARSANNQLTDRQNRARPNGRIPDIYGTVRSTPDLIATPYTVFESNQEVEIAYMCIGRGSFDISDVRDDSTLVSSIPGAAVEVYGPGTSPNGGSPQLTIGSAIGRPVQTAKRITSVNGQVLEPLTWVGPFDIDLRNMNRIQCNIVAVRGMFKDDGDQTSTSVSVQVEVTPLDSAGIPAGAPITVSGTVVGSATDQDLKGITINVNLGTEYQRARVRVRRTTPLNTSFEGTVVDEVKWRDCYGMAPVTQTDFGDVTTVMAETYATAGALAVKDRKLNMLVTRKLPSRSGTGPNDHGFTTTLTATRNAADILCAMALDPVVGRLTGGNPPRLGGTGEVDVPQIYSEVAAIQAYFGLTEAGQFSYTFDEENLSFQEMAQIVGNAVFSQVYRRGSLLRLFFERPQTDSVLLFNHRNKVPNSETRSFSFGSVENHDGVEMRYTDPSDNAVVTLYVPQGDDTALNPFKLEGKGVRGFEHAYLHAWRQWNKLQYRFLTEVFEGLQEADLLVRFNRILSVDTTRSSVMDGDVLEQDGLELRLSQAAVLDPGETYTCFLQLSTGTVEAISVTQGSDEYRVLLEEAPSEPLVVNEGAAYRTGYVIVRDGDDAQIATPMIVTEKKPNDNFTVGVTAVNYDARYYANDLDFIAGDGGDTTDPSDPEVVDGTPDPGVSVSISPPATATSSSAPSVTRTFTASATGGTPSSYTWGVSSGPGAVVTQGAAAADLRAYDTDGIGALAEFFCDMVIAGVTYRAFCTMYHQYTGDTIYPPGVRDPLVNPQ